MEMTHDSPGDDPSFGRLTEEKVQLLKALLVRETFTYEDLALLSGKTKGTVRTKMHRLTRDGVILLEHVAKQKRGRGRAGRSLDVWRLAPGAREKLIMALREARAADIDKVPRRKVTSLKILEDARKLISSAERENDPLSQRQQRCGHVKNLIERAKDLVAKCDRGSEVEISSELRWHLKSTVEEAERVSQRIDDQLAESAAKSEQEASFTLENAETGKRGVIKATFEHLDALATGSDDAGSRHVDRFAGVLMARGMAKRNTTIDEVAVRYSREPRFASALGDAVIEVTCRAVGGGGWQNLAYQVLSGASEYPFVQAAGMLDTFQAVCEIKGTDEAVKHQAREIVEIHAPRGAGVGLSEERWVDELLESLA